jgi:hypothetical protein
MIYIKGIYYTGLVVLLLIFSSVCCFSSHFNSYTHKLQAKSSQNQGFASRSHSHIWDNKSVTNSSTEGNLRAFGTNGDEDDFAVGAGEDDENAYVDGPSVSLGSVPLLFIIGITGGYLFIREYWFKNKNHK